MNKKIIMTSLLVPVIIISSAVSFQCKSSDNLETGSNKINKSSNPYFPVKNDSKWQYINEAPRDETELFNVSVTGAESSGKDVIVIFDSFPFFTKQNEQTKIKIRQNGEVYVLGKDSKENLLLPQPSLYEKN